MKAFIAQIERVNPKVNAIVTFLPDAALAAARKFDRSSRQRRTTPTWQVEHASRPRGWHDDPQKEGTVSERLPTGTDEEREAAVEAASLAVQRGELIVLPTDTVFGIGADAFDPAISPPRLRARSRWSPRQPRLGWTSPAAARWLTHRSPNSAACHPRSGKA